MSENIKVLVTGASGTLGSAVTPRLVKQGYAVRPMTRSARDGWVTADLRTGEGLDEAVRDVDVIVHLASSPGRPRQTDVEGTRLLLAAARKVGVGHVLYVSINGIDRVPYAYYRAKLDTEEVVRASGVPYTILRAAQFHDFAETMLSMLGKAGPVLVDPAWKLQPVAVEDVADRIAELIARPAAGETTEYAGPQVLTFDELARTWLAARGKRRPIWRLSFPGKMSRAMRAGGQTTDATPAGTRTWRGYLAEKY
ncbi:NAD(P)H-binding protein [Paractinoplanes ferrugineus]|uniref:Nucleotide-diphosphate-sugar epimerase n=1 Tax=Paractinoplanes ferrugineus TaxID=113564 RepID=A0A919J143_9ACTN|nr:NAD(P)H-binding protein [Actinoplanes ferrugineus]GIE11789.1 nucleotide-diphosphate-sugar epimerase [Actinoplanes ferrugineus]